MKCLLSSVFLCLAAFNACADEGIKAQALSVHNELRALHHAPKLSWDNQLAQYAEKYASRCVFKHSSSPYGENLAAGYPGVAAAILAWYAEGENYSYSHPGYRKGLGHFTQLVWASSKKLGCASVSCNGKNGTPGQYLVCEYSPAGNITNQGYFERNVLPKPPTKMASNILGGEFARIQTEKFAAEHFRNGKLAKRIREVLTRVYHEEKAAIQAFDDAKSICRFKMHQN